jgi:hypothetical protein
MVKGDEPLVIPPTASNRHHDSDSRHRRAGNPMNEIVSMICNGVLVLSAIGMGYVVLAGKGYGGSK